MDVATRIGLFPFAGWTAGHSFWVTLLICWAITPGMMILVGLVGESRLIPLSPSRQYVSFFPGDLLLGAGVACFLEAAKGLPEERRWYAAPIVGITILAAGVAFSVWRTKVEWAENVYPPMATVSPTNLYHKIALYVAYAYLAGTTLIADLAGLSLRHDWEWLAAGLAFIIAWLPLVMLDNLPSARAKAQYAHVSDWAPLPLVAFFAVRQLVRR